MHSPGSPWLFYVKVFRWIEASAVPDALQSRSKIASTIGKLVLLCASLGCTFVFGGESARAEEFPREGCWTAWRYIHPRLQGERRLILRVTRDSKLLGLEESANEDRGDGSAKTPKVWGFYFYQIETDHEGNESFEIHRFFYNARVEDGKVALYSGWQLEKPDGRLVFAIAGKGFHILSETEWPRNLPPEKIPVRSYMGGPSPVASDDILMYFEPVPEYDVAGLLFRIVGRFAPIPGPITIPVSIPETDPDLEAVRAVLKKYEVTRYMPGNDSPVVSAQIAAHLSCYGEKAMLLLGYLLHEKHYASDAASALLAINRIKAGPIILPEIAEISVETQHEILSWYQTDLERGVNLPFTNLLHDTAVGLAEAALERGLKPFEHTSDLIPSEALAIVAITGSPADIPLLQRYLNAPEDALGLNGYWLKHSANKALARLGDSEALRRIEEELAKPIPTPFPDADATSLSNWISAAGFSRNKRFVPILIRHLDTPAPQLGWGSSPSEFAARALEQIVNGAASADAGRVRTDWKQWWQENSEFYQGSQLIE